MITVEEIEKLEVLSRIKLSDVARSEYAKQMGSIIDYINEIRDLDLPDTNLDITDTNKYRDDVSMPRVDYRELALDNAPDKLGNYFKVSQVIKQ
jgi:aspartyl-tRNA(Asn)/glutamyl-tRNA(Gln) amidotransferase subunit C